MSLKIACVLVPGLPIQVEQQRRNITLPILIPHPLDHSAIFAASPEVVEAGVRVGMSLYQAQQMAPTALVIEPDELAYHSCHGSVFAALQAYSPLIETAGLGEFLVDVRGLERLHGDDAALAGALAGAAQAAAGLVVQVGLAGGKFIAQQAARQAPPGGAVVVPPGAEAEFLAPLSVDVLPHLPGEVRRRLALLDLHVLGDLAALRKPAVLRQFGSELAGLYELARGNDPRPLNLDVPPLRIVRSLRLAGPVSERAVLLNALQRLCWQMSKVLAAKGYHAEGLKLTLYTTSGAALEIGQAAKPPTSDEAQLGRLAALLLGKLAVSQPVTVLALSAYPLRSWHLGLHQISLAEAGTPATRKQTRFDTALQLLVHRFGELVLRVAALVGPPVPIRVTVTLGGDGNPVSYELGGENNPVVEVDDTWREERDWWSRPLRRDYFRVVMPDGSLRKLFQDLVDDEWYLDRSWPIL
jgi:nucleotidyltransferase/DNA polymerase involved in DNA repair